MKFFGRALALAVIFVFALFAHLSVMTDPHTGLLDVSPAAIQKAEAQAVIDNYRYAAAGSIINRIQSFSITIAASSTSNTATITSVNTSYAHLIWGGQTTDSSASSAADPNAVHANVVLTNGTTVTATRNTSAATTTTVNGWVVEYKPAAIQSIQAGTITMTAVSSNTATISSVTTTHAAVFYLGETTTDSTANANRYYSRLNLTNATTVTATRGNATSNVTVSYAVVEYAAGVLNSNSQEQTITLTAATSNTGTISSVTTGQTMLAWGGFSGTLASNSQDRKPYAVLTNGTTITVSRTSSTDNVTAVVTALEFRASAIQSIQRNTTAIGSGATTNDATITAVNTSNTIVSWLGYTNSTTVTRNDLSMTRNSLQSSTAARSTRAVSDTNTITTSFEAVEFKP